MTDMSIKGLESLRKHSGYSEEQLAMVMNVDQATYRKYENASLEFLMKNITVDQIADLTLFYNLGSTDETKSIIEGRYHDFFRHRAERIITGHFHNLTPSF